MKLYRTVSEDEFKDYNEQKEFRVGRNTIEGKQFFKTEAGVNEFVKSAKRRGYLPAYKHIFIVEVNLECLQSIPFDEQELDRFEAVTIHERDLHAFNNCVKFVEQKDV